jgi:hypothetical protein
MVRFLLIWNSPVPKREYIPVSAETKRVMEYHGTWYLICPEGEKCYFMREGKRCRI